MRLTKEKIGQINQNYKGVNDEKIFIHYLFSFVFLFHS